MLTTRRDRDLFIADLGDGDNRLDPATIDAFGELLDEIETAAESGPTALVTTASGKIWSNGLDLEHMGALDGAGLATYLSSAQRLMARLLRLPVPTVAAVGGHCFAGGGLLALAHDARVMRADRGFFCLPEVDLGMQFGEGFTALVKAKTSQPATHRVAVLGERLGAPQAVELGVVDAAVAEAEVYEHAVERALALSSKAGRVLPRIRADFYGDALAALEA